MGRTMRREGGKDMRYKYNQEARRSANDRQTGGHRSAEGETGTKNSTDHRVSVVVLNHRGICLGLCTGLRTLTSPRRDRLRRAGRARASLEVLLQDLDRLIFGLCCTCRGTLASNAGGALVVVLLSVRDRRGDHHGTDVCTIIA